jgi:hypothetical protein
MLDKIFEKSVGPGRSVWAIRDFEGLGKGGAPGRRGWVVRVHGGVGKVLVRSYLFIA